MKCNIVIPRLSRCPWQQEDHVRQNLRYTSHSIDKKIHLTLLLLYYKTVLWEFFLHFFVNSVLRIRTLRNRVSRGMTVVYLRYQLISSYKFSNFLSTSLLSASYPPWNFLIFYINYLHKIFWNSKLSLSSLSLYTRSMKFPFILH